MPKFRGVGERMKARLRAVGYVKPNGDLDVQRFVLDFRYPTALFYDWLADRRTPIKDLERLAADLKTSQPFLLFGIDVEIPRVAPAPVVERRRKDRRGKRPVPIRGGSAQGAPLPTATDPEGMSLIRRGTPEPWWPRAA